MIHPLSGLDIVRKIILIDSFGENNCWFEKCTSFELLFLITDELNSCCSRIGKTLFIYSCNCIRTLDLLVFENCFGFE